jgi:hypothetical protein
MSQAPTASRSRQSEFVTVGMRKPLVLALLALHELIGRSCSPQIRKRLPSIRALTCREAYYIYVTRARLTPPTLSVSVLNCLIHNFVLLLPCTLPLFYLPTMWQVRSYV